MGSGDLGTESVAKLDKRILYARLDIPLNGHIPGLKPFEAINKLPKAGPKVAFDMDSLLEWADTLEPEYRQLDVTPVIPRGRTWALEEEELAPKLPVMYQLIRGHLHQIQAMAVLADQAFKEVEGAVHVGSLVADSMGLGKTMSSLAYAMIVAHWSTRQAQGDPLSSHFGT